MKKRTTPVTVSIIEESLEPCMLTSIDLAIDIMKNAVRIHWLNHYHKGYRKAEWWDYCRPHELLVAIEILDDYQKRTFRLEEHEIKDVIDAIEMYSYCFNSTDKDEIVFCLGLVLRGIYPWCHSINDVEYEIVWGKRRPEE